MAESAETVSIIIPTYYRNDMLREAVETALGQTYEMTEVIVVDDSGERHAEPVAEEYESLTYVPLEENVGENQARGAGLDVATGQYIQFLDDDDLLDLDKISKQRQQLDDKTGVVYSGLRNHETGEVIRPDPAVRGDVLTHALEFELWPPCFTSSLLIDRDVLEQVRPLRFHGAGDTYFLIGLAERTQFDFVDEPLVEKRSDGDSLGFTLDNVSNKRQILAAYAELYDNHPDCRAAALTHIYTQEGHVRLADTVWSPRAIDSFARAAYHTRSNRITHATTAFGSLFGWPGVTAVSLLGKFIGSCRDAGPMQAFRRASQSVFSR